MSDASSCIPPNPDISGIGVRIAIYAQNLLCFVPVVIHLLDGKITAPELDGIKDQSIGMLAIAFAILISTVVQAKSGGRTTTITNYHAAIILDLSWINNTSTWIWFILFMHHRTRPPPQRRRDESTSTVLWSTAARRRRVEVPPVTPASLGPWFRILGYPLRALFFPMFRSSSDEIRAAEGRFPRHLWLCVKLIFFRVWHFLSYQSVLTIGSLHLSVMGIIGIWLWANPNRFGAAVDCDPTLTIVGTGVAFSSRALRIGSLIMYSLVLLPGFNLLPPFIFFVVVHVAYNHLRRVIFILYYRRNQSRYIPDAELRDIEKRTSARSPAVHALVGCLAFLVLFNVIFIVDIERTLRANTGSGADPTSASTSTADDEWGFGQVLALLLLVIPLKDTYKALRDVRERTRVQGQLDEGVAEREALKAELSREADAHEEVSRAWQARETALEEEEQEHEQAILEVPAVGSSSKMTV